MKKLALLIILSLSLCAAFAQEKDNDWKERVKREKIAYLSTELELTSEQAQVFWPVYNAIWEAREQAQCKVMASFKALDEAIKAGAPESEIAAKLEEYIKSQSAMAEITANSVEKYKNVLPLEKVAKLYVCEEKFRFEQMRKLHHGHGPTPKI